MGWGVWALFSKVWGVGGLYASMKLDILIKYQSKNKRKPAYVWKFSKIMRNFDFQKPFEIKINGLLKSLVNLKEINKPSDIISAFGL